MDKSEKCYYVIIKNKKCGKFSGAGPIQVAKKVASKKLKLGKDMEFYLDEVAGKKKRYGPYQARKDKKSGKVVVVKGRKVMRGGLLSRSDKDILTRAFNENQTVQEMDGYIKPVQVDINLYYKLPPFFFKSLLILFNPENKLYKYAIFVESNRIYLWILQKKDEKVEFINFCEFFLNPNPEYLNSNDKRMEIIETLIQQEYIGLIRPIEGNIIKSFLEEIKSVIFPASPAESKKAIYYPDYSRLLIRKCVYPNLTFGILDEETQPARIPQDISDFQKVKSPYQKYLILKNTGISGMSFNEPIIYVRVANIVQNQRGGTLTAEQIQAKINNLRKELEQIKIEKSYINKILNEQKVLQPQRNVGHKTSESILKQEGNNRILSNNLLKGIINIQTEIQQLEQQLQQQQQQQLEQQQQLQLQLQQQQLQQQQLQQQQLQQQQLQQLQLQQLQLQQPQLQQRENQKFKRSINSNNTEALQEFRKELQQQLHPAQLQQVQLQQQLHFDYCIFSSGSKLKIRSYIDNTVQDFILYENNLMVIDKQIFHNLLDIPREFGEFRRIRDISDRRIRQETPQQLVPQISPASRTTQGPPVIYQQEPLTINFFEKKIRDLFMESTRKNLKINIDILLQELNPIIEELHILETTYKNKQQVPELQIKLKNLYQELGIKYKDVLRKSKELPNNSTALQ